MTHWFLRFIDWARRTPWMIVPVVLTCLGVGGWGFYAYYGAQFAWIGLERWYVFPFVPDCPLFVYLFVVALGLHYLGVAPAAFVAFAAIGNIKYGVWTVFVLLYYFESFFAGAGAEAAFRSVILALHIGMVPLGILLWRTLPVLRPRDLAIAVGLLLVYDYFDYFFTRDYQIYPIGLPSRPGHVPLAWNDPNLVVVTLFTIVETLALGLLMWRLNGPRRAAADA